MRAYHSFIKNWRIKNHEKLNDWFHFIEMARRFKSSMKMSKASLSKF